MKFIVSFFIAVFISLSALAGNVNDVKSNLIQVTVDDSCAGSQFMISGSVTDKNNNETLAGATIEVGGKKVYSDLDGNFALPVSEQGVYNLKVELISYETAELQIEVKNDGDFPQILALK